MKEGKRKRKTRACYTCRLKKLKCDQQTPCSRCREKGLESSCSYENKGDETEETNQYKDRQQKKKRLNDTILSDSANHQEKVPEILQEMQRRMKHIEGLLSRQDDKCSGIGTNLTIENQYQPGEFLGTSLETGRRSTKDTLREDIDLHTTQSTSELSSDVESSTLQSPAYSELEGSGYGKVYQSVPKTEEWHQQVKELQKYCSLLPSREMMLMLFNTYTYRIQCFAGHFVHAPTLLAQLHQLYDIDDEFKAEALANGRIGGPSFLAMVLTMLALGLRYFPIAENDKNNHEILSIMAIQEASEEFQQIWVQSAIKCLSTQAISAASSMTFIQASPFLVLYAMTKSSFHQSPENKLNQLLFEHSTCITRESIDLDSQNLAQSAVRLLRVAISHALVLNLHRVKPEEDGLEAEMRRRVWWALCFREWTFSSEDIQNRLPSVRIGDFTTTLPKDINDQDLIQNLSQTNNSKHDARHSLQHALYKDVKVCKLPKEMTFVRAMLQYGLLVAEQNEIQLRGEFDSESEAKSITSLLQKYSSFNESLPTFFQSEVDTSSYEDCSVPMDVQKWLLQSAVLSRILSIYRASLWKDDVGREMCASTARSILTIQKRLRGKNKVVDDFWINLSQSYSAALVLCEQIFHNSKDDQVLVDTATSELIQEAILALRQTARRDPTAMRCANLLQQLWQQLIKSMTRATMNTDIDKNKDSEIIQIIENIKSHSGTSNLEQSNLSFEFHKEDPIHSEDTQFVQNPIVMQAYDIQQMPGTPLFTPNGLDLSFKFNKVHDEKTTILGGLHGTISKELFTFASQNKGTSLSTASSDNQQRTLSSLPQSEGETTDDLLVAVWNWLYEQGVIDTKQRKN